MKDLTERVLKVTKKNVAGITCEIGSFLTIVKQNNDYEDRHYTVKNKNCSTYTLREDTRLEGTTLLRAGFQNPDFPRDYAKPVKSDDPLEEEFVEGDNVMLKERPRVKEGEPKSVAYNYENETFVRLLIVEVRRNGHYKVQYGHSSNKAFVTNSRMIQRFDDTLSTRNAGSSKLKRALIQAPYSYKAGDVVSNKNLGIDCEFTIEDNPKFDEYGTSDIIVSAKDGGTYTVFRDGYWADNISRDKSIDWKTATRDELIEEARRKYSIGDLVIALPGDPITKPGHTFKLRGTGFDSSLVSNTGESYVFYEGKWAKTSNIELPTTCPKVDEDDWSKATSQALIREAKRRYNIGDVLRVLPGSIVMGDDKYGGKKWKLRSLDFKSSAVSNSGEPWVFYNNQWAEIVEPASEFTEDGEKYKTDMELLLDKAKEMFPEGTVADNTNLGVGCTFMIKDPDFKTTSGGDITVFTRHEKSYGSFRIYKNGVWAGKVRFQFDSDQINIHKGNSAREEVSYFKASSTSIIKDPLYIPPLPPYIRPYLYTIESTSGKKAPKAEMVGDLEFQAPVTINKNKNKKRRLQTVGANYKN